jgi:HAE1 family hydrophobic/amphiphilic exporter-1
VKTKPVRIFDETTAITHSHHLMQPRTILILALALSWTVGANAQSTTDTNQPQQTGTNQLQTTDTNQIQQTATNQMQQAGAGTNQPVPPDTNLVQTTGTPPAPPRKERVVSLQDCLQFALQHNLDIQIQRYNPIISQFTLDVSYDTYEPTFTFTANKQYNSSPGALITDTNGNIVRVSGNQNESDNYTPAINGVLPTGLTYNLNGTWTRDSIWNQPANGGGYWLPPEWSAGPGVTLQQPLLRNFWIDQNRLTIQVNKVALQTSEQALRLQIMTTVFAVQSAYYTLLFDRGNVDANVTALQLAQQLAANNKKQVEIGTLAPLDEKQAEAQAAASLAALQAARQALVIQENTLKNLITDDYMQWVDISPKPAEQLVAVPQVLDRQTSWRRALAERPELLEAQLNVKKQGITLKYDLNQIFPELDVTGSYGRNAFDSDFGQTFADISRGDNTFYSYGAIFSIPLAGNLSARNTYKSGKATLKQLLLSLKQEEQTILVAVDNDVGQVQSTLEQVNSTHAARLYAEDALKAEQTKLENGKSTSFNVLQLISNLTTARVNEIQALANYNIAVAQLSIDQGSTLEDNKIDLKLK